MKKIDSHLLEEQQVANQSITEVIQQWQQNCNIPDAQVEEYASNTRLSIETFRQIKQGLRPPSAAELKELAHFVRKPDGAHFSVQELGDITGIQLH